MRVYVNDEPKELHVYDRETGVDFAKSVLCAQDQLEKNMYGEFCLTPEEYDFWTGILATQQETEDMYFSLKQNDAVNREELENYIYEETKYITETKFIVENENISLKALVQAVERKDGAWLRDNGLPKTAKNVEKE